MSNAVTVETRIQYKRSGVTVQSGPLARVEIATTSEITRTGTQVVGTTHEVLDIGDVTDDAMLIVENLHATAEVQIGGDESSVFVPWVTIPAGYPQAVFPVVPALAEVYLKSDTASTPVQVRLFKIVAPA
jgi:hypothetical protein